MRIVKFKVRYILILLIILMISASSTFAASKGYEHLQVQSLKTEATTLADKGMYGAALSKLEETEGKWTFEKTREEISFDKEGYKHLVESSDNYEQGKMSFDGKDYEEAIEYFEKVLKSDVNYKSAQGWIVLAQDKLVKGEEKETPTKSVAGAKTNVVSTPIPTTNLINNSRAQTLKNLFTRLGQLQGSIGVYQVLLDDASKNSVNCEEKYGRQYLSTGALNPNFIMTPSTQAQTIQLCQDNGSSSIFSQINLIKKQMNDVRREILDIASNCSSSECVNALEALSQLELGGIF